MVLPMVCLGQVSQSELQISAVHAAPSPGEVLGDMSMSAVLAATPSRMAGVAGKQLELIYIYIYIYIHICIYAGIPILVYIYIYIYIY